MTIHKKGLILRPFLSWGRLLMCIHQKKSLFLRIFLIPVFFIFTNVYANETTHLTSEITKVYWLGDSKSSVEQAYYKSLFWGAKTVRIPEPLYDEKRMCNGNLLCQQLNRYLPTFPYEDKTNYSFIGAHIGPGNYLNKLIPRQSGSSVLGTLPKFRDGDDQLDLVIRDLATAGDINASEVLVVIDGLGTSNLSTLPIDVIDKEWDEVQSLTDDQQNKIEEAVNQLIIDTAETYKKYIEKAHKEGKVQKFLIREIPAIQLAPSYVTVKKANEGLAPVIDSFAEKVNQLIAEKVNAYAHDHNVQVAIVPLYERMVDGVSNPKKYGFFKDTSLYLHQIYRGALGSEYAHDTAKTDKDVQSLAYHTPFVDDAHTSESLNELFALYEAIVYLENKDISEMLFNDTEEKYQKALAYLHQEKQRLLEKRRQKLEDFKTSQKDVYAWIQKATESKTRFASHYHFSNGKLDKSSSIMLFPSHDNVFVSGVSFANHHQSNTQEGALFGQTSIKGITISSMIQINNNQDDVNSAFNLELKYPWEAAHSLTFVPYMSFDHIISNKALSNMSFGLNTQFDQKAEELDMTFGLAAGLSYQNQYAQNHTIKTNMNTIWGPVDVVETIDMSQSTWHGFVSGYVSKDSYASLSLQYDIYAPMGDQENIEHEVALKASLRF